MKSFSKIGLLRATSIVAGNMIGSGALLAPALLAQYGKMSIIGWLLTTAGALCLALVFSRLSVWIAKAGGVFTYARNIFGDFVGFQMACSYWFSAIFGSVSLVHGTLQYISIFYPGIVDNPILSICFGCVMIWIFTAINSYGIKTASLVEVIILSIKILPLVAVALFGLFFINLGQTLDMSGITMDKFTASLGGMSGILLWSFLGLESITIPSDQIDNPKTTIPKAIVCGVLITAAVYIFGTIVINGIIPYDELIISKSPYVDAGKKMLGNFGNIVMIVTGVIGIIGSLNGWILIQGQVPFAAANEGIFPTYFGKTNKHGAPVGVVWGSVIMAAAFALSYQPSLLQSVELMIDVAVLATVIPYFYCVIGYAYLAICKKDTLSPKEKFFIPVIFTVALAYTILAILGMGEKIVFLSFLMLLAVTPIYCFMKYGKE